MAKYRQVHTHMWKDPWFLDLEPKHKLFFVYLFTNERASISGLYELSKRVMMFESGLTASEIDAAFQAFAANEKAFFADDVVWVVNLRKYHETKSPKIQKAIEDDVSGVKDGEIKRIYCAAYGMDRVSCDTLDIPRSSSSNGSGSRSSLSLNFPEQLQTDQFKAAWGRWVNHLKARDKTVTAPMAQETINYLAAFGHDGALATVTHSLRNGWLSLHPPDDDPAVQSTDVGKAYAAIKKEVERVGRMGKPDLSDDHQALVNAAGGWLVLCSTKERDLQRVIAKAAETVEAIA